MFVDARDMETDQILRSDLCIIGAGAAGITIAHALKDKAVDVCLLEAGGLEYSEQSQSMYQGRNVGVPYLPLDACRLRYFGGTTNHWGGQCQPLTTIDFQKRPWIRDSGWPITRESLDPFYLRAQSVLKLGPMAYEEENWNLLGFTGLGVDRRKLVQRRWQFSPPVRFGRAFHDDLHTASNIKVVLNANVDNIQATATGTAISGVDFRTLEGHRGRAVARAYVLACGGIENARMLLVSNTVEENGLGNRHGQVGRFFMTHANVTVGKILSTNSKAFVAALGDQKSSFGGLHPSETLQEAEEILNAGAIIEFRETTESAILAARAIKIDIEAGKVPDDLAGALWRVIRDIDDVAVALWQHYVEDRSTYNSASLLSLGLDLEQVPSADSRVSLTSDVDALGMKRVALDLRLTDLHKRTALAVTNAVAAEIGRLGLGRVQLADWLRNPGDKQPPNIHWLNHHMGTTRMSEDPRAGVVDSDCKVHNIENLYVAGSSVFSTGGYANPTLTIVALALRLADHLKTRFKSRI